MYRFPVSRRSPDSRGLSDGPADRHGSKLPDDGGTLPVVEPHIVLLFLALLVLLGLIRPPGGALLVAAVLIGGAVLLALPLKLMSEEK